MAVLPGSSLCVDTFRRLKPLEKDHCLLPIGWGADRKGPMLRGWTTHRGFSVEQLQEFPGALAVGIRSSLLYTVDFDGASAVAHAQDQGLDPQGCATWHVSRDTDDSRLKLIFRPTATQISQAIEQGVPANGFQFNEKTGVGEQLEHFFSPARQVIVAGRHWKSGGHYFWPDSNGPEQLSAPPQWWWLRTLEEYQLQNKPRARSASTTSRGEWLRLGECPICGRGHNDNPICQLHVDGQTLRCFRGGTFAPPEGLSPGQLVAGTDWAFSRESSSGWGEFLTFVKDKPNHHQLLRRLFRRG